MTALIAGETQGSPPALPLAPCPLPPSAADSACLGFQRSHFEEEETWRTGFPGGSVVKNPTAFPGDLGDPGSIPGLGRSPGEGKGSIFQYSCLENSMDRGAWWATVHGLTKSQAQLRDWVCRRNLQLRDWVCRRNLKNSLLPRHSDGGTCRGEWDTWGQSLCLNYRENRQSRLSTCSTVPA